MKKSILLSVFIMSILVPRMVLGQQTGNTVASGGASGIYVTLGNVLPSPIHPVNGGVSYLVERRVSGEPSWQAVAKVSSPASRAEFLSRLQEFMSVVPEAVPISELPVDTLWQKIEKYRIADSLNFWSGALFVDLAIGTVYLDSTVQKGAAYQYRVSLLDTSGKPIMVSVSNVVPYPEVVRLQKLHLFEKIGNEKYVFLKWRGVGGKNGRTFKVYRQDSLQGAFRVVAAARALAMAHDTTFYLVQDTLVQPVAAYRYYALPMDYYGNSGDPSDTALVATYNFNSVPLPEYIHVVSLDSSGGVQISWRLKDQRLVRNLMLFRSVDYDTGYQRIAIIPTRDTSFTDQTAEAMKKYFYYLVMNGPLGEASANSPRVFGIYVSPTPPQPPIIVRAVGVSNGVQLKILFTDVTQAAYRVFRNDGYRPGLRLISGLIIKKDSIAIFNDTSSVLSGELTYAYAVKAENSSHVSGNFSDTVLVRPHIPTHPPTPMGLTAIVEGSGIKLYWQDMQPMDNALNGYIVFRRESSQNPKKAAKFAKLTDSLLSASRNWFTNTTAEQEKNYQYAVRAYDIFGGESPMSTISSAEVAAVRPIPPGGIRASAAGNGILIRWDEAYQPDLKEYRVYRYQRRIKPIPIANVPAAGKLGVIDGKARANQLYFYFVTSINTKGVESERSQEVGIRR